MSIIDEPMTVAHTESERVVWRTPVDGLWVAETPTDYLGMVDRNHDGYVASGAAGQDLGVFPTREGAQLAVYSRWFLGEPSTPRTSTLRSSGLSASPQSPIKTRGRARTSATGTATLR